MIHEGYTSVGHITNSIKELFCYNAQIYRVLSIKPGWSTHPSHTQQYPLICHSTPFLIQDGWGLLLSLY